MARWLGAWIAHKTLGEAVDLTVIDETGTKSEQVRVPDTAASGRIAARLAQVMGLPRVGADGQPISYGFRHERSGRQLGDEETLTQALVGQNDVLRLVSLAPIPGYTPAPEPAETQRLQPAPAPPQASTVSQPAGATVLSPAPPPPPSQQAATSTRFWPRSVAIALTVLAVALVGVAVALIVGHGGRHKTRLVAHDVVTETVGASGSSTTPEGEPTESTGGETGDTTASVTVGEALPNVSTQQMGLEIQQTLRDWHEDVVRGDYHAAWELLSRRKQAQAEGEGGYTAWAKNQSTLRPYLNPAGLQVSVQDTGSESAVAQVEVTGMTWDKPGAHCSEWSGITWVKYENGEWHYDPGYSTTQQRDRDWRSRYTELLGGGC